jgi:peptidoglycan/LPS O-acetylase OafA/YrhL
LNRLSRLWSVVIPALLLGILLVPVFVGKGLTGVANIPSLVAPVPLDWSCAGIDSALNLFFLSEIWWLDNHAPFNTPFWSLSYEAAYYTIFAAWFFAAPRWRLPLTVACCALAGPKILLLMPCWILGVWLYRHSGTRNLHSGIAVLLFIGSAIGYLAMFWFDLAGTIRTNMYALWPWSMNKFGASNKFIGDNIIAFPLTIEPQPV